MGTGSAGRAVLYAAKSTEDTRGSIAAQLSDGREFAQQEGLEIVAEYSEADVSAYKGNRGPELAAALDHVEQLGGTLRSFSTQTALREGTASRPATWWR
jgi:DNA invertase Pin-like site-specific DNA recombinase